MHDVFADDGPVQLFIHDDDETPLEFVQDLLRTVFGKSQQDAIASAALIEANGAIPCGPYPAPVARALLTSAKWLIRSKGQPLLITTESADASRPCDLCEAPRAVKEIFLSGTTASLCSDCLLAARRSSEELPSDEFRYAFAALEWHFAGIPRNQILTRSRRFPGHMRADVQIAIDRLFTTPLHFFGIHEASRYETIEFAALMKDSRDAPAIAPPQYHDVDVGEAEPVKCLVNGLWLCRTGELRYAVLLSFHREYGYEPTLRIELAVPAGAAGNALVQRTLAELEAAVHAARSYRGKILSLDGDADYRGRSRGVTVHRLPVVDRDAVILPERTLRLLERNVLDFVGSRELLRELGQSTRKGILLYGPPGTGKTHTIRYLATNLPGHTTLIITAEQVGLLGAYMSLARLLQPTMVVIEDVDLIARSREEMGGPCEESLLNKLLNEMDGLKEDCDILFVLTTNRPEELESALAGRPGRIDQAIEVPLPDEIGRGKLVRLYGKGLPLDQGVIDDAVRRTEGVSAAFIKELMRRLAQASIARDGGQNVTPADIEGALNEMLFDGGHLNVKLLGGAQKMSA
ncbi:ATP-dependent Clp protease adaptor ClpS [Bradyrhizobium sp. ISRA443]|uniref:ATP-dependent Clp protease adaptor ClpS n=1 Tax=unclassified Bradyrhizobium TaxID=2631580 RepID=UPI00247ABE59|nr:MULTISPECIES: ATP-dependent Clp protease adaptor ClpS [unclassified Bradyrhizobium]WGR95060.1 ATP-dependent Clp protease adaptor ClpS [Bradyrhizobium sp. ISRA435]WGR99947.1 ATP-dependent Clp protease adaptor ClpS [Bradyrhizobium sp. ISRA436]WGS06838.1 ATP-dependent Clp protease adaptor ClpS [Bradyrhizobium sp. ISRA437]WGS13720.1 ATP-dependent Clp protease adaptor ClpS [Bradyrhizobium sp. ISRA443]